MRKLFLVILCCLLLAFVPASAQETDVIDSSQESSQSDAAGNAPTRQEEEQKSEDDAGSEASREARQTKGVETDEDGNLTLSNGLRITLQTPSSLVGYKVTVKDSDGNSITEKNVSASGTTELEMSTADRHPTVIINTDQIQANPEETVSTGFSMLETVLYAGAGALASAVIFYFIGRRKGLKIVDELRDYIHEEKLD